MLNVCESTEIANSAIHFRHPMTIVLLQYYSRRFVYYIVIVQIFTEFHYCPHFNCGKTKASKTKDMKLLQDVDNGPI